MALTKKKKLAVLKRTRELLARPNGWHKGSFRQTRKGHRYVAPWQDHTPEQFAEANSFCIAGAARQALREIDPDIRLSEDELCQKLSLETLARAKAVANGIELGEDDFGVYTFNDSRKTRKKDVVALLDEKIAEVESA